MIYQGYEIWTENGWERVSNIELFKVMVFNSKTRYSSFRVAEKITNVICKNNYSISNINCDLIFNIKNTFLNNNYKIISMKDLFDNNSRKLLVNSKTLFIPDRIEKIENDFKFITFDLEDYEFVLIRNVYPIYVGWLCKNVGNKKKTTKVLTRGK